MSAGQCDRCRYWSEMIAKSDHGNIVALCLGRGSPFYQTYTKPVDRCLSFHLGDAIDNPYELPVRKP